tara:strand:- start:4212 stop:5933 length:1722 start_codon:yes stop_codon:yes gene_type:complete
MNNTTLQVKIKQRMNKIDSQDYDNIKSWEIAEAFNKAQLEWCRRQLAGTNIRKEGDEMSKRRIDDLSILLTRKRLLGVDIEYDDTFGYFKSTNFASIYDPEQGGDYLEFKRIECGGQQCFPFGPEQTGEITVENTATIPGYWQENPPTIETIVTPGSTERFTQDIRRVPIFTFLTLGQHGSVPLPGNGQGNVVISWGEPFGDVIPGVPPFQATPSGVTPQEVVTNEPWVYNNTLTPEFWYSNGNASSLNVYNENIIPPFTTSGGSGGWLTSCQYCGSSASEIYNDTDTLSTFCQQANAQGVGYVVGGPNNEYIDCTSQPAVYTTIPDLVALAGVNGGILNEQYPYTNQPNNWVNDTVQIFDVQTDALCAASGCWYIPSSVEFQTMSITNWVTIPGSTVVNVIENPPTYIPEQTITYETTETGVTVPFQQCYCAPGADKESFCTNPRTMTVYQSEVANVDVILRDPLKRPDFNWCETFCTLESNAEDNTPSIRIWRKDFYIMDPVLVYYRVPRRVQIVGSVDPYTGSEVAADVNCEFKDDIVELLIDYTASILAGDISDANQMIRGEQQGEKNN